MWSSTSAAPLNGTRVGLSPLAADGTPLSAMNLQAITYRAVARQGTDPRAKCCRTGTAIRCSAGVQPPIVRTETEGRIILDGAHVTLCPVINQEASPCLT
jgi:hypothetical protein